jgi:hypothetical protein
MSGGSLPRAGGTSLSLGNVESRLVLGDVDRGFGGDSAGTERGEDEKNRTGETANTENIGYRQDKRSD